jgi:hypothetical protein
MPMKLFKNPIFFILFFQSSFFLSQAIATSFVSVPLEKRVYESPIIVRGKTGNSYSDWVIHPDGSRQIFTFTELDVTEVLKGDVKSSQILIREIGGEKDGIGLSVPGAATFRPGEDVVVTLDNSDDPKDGYRIQGMSMGKYTVEKDPDGNEYLSGGSLSLERGSKRTTLGNLRQIIDSQKSAPVPTIDPKQFKILHNHELDSNHSPHPSAPNLQPLEPENETGHVDDPPVGNTFPWVWVILLVATVGGGWVWLRNRKR